MYQDYISDLINLLESKDRFIDKLDITDDQKTQLKDFFKKYPNLESKIDWNKKDLTFKDFEDLLATEGKSKSQAKKKGLEGITEGVDYKVLEQGENYIAYQPLTYRGSMTIASNRVPPVKGNGAQWCTAYQKTDEYWNKYTISYRCRFCYVCNADTKYALVLYPPVFTKQVIWRRLCFSFTDEQIACPQKYKHLYKALMTDEEKEAYKAVEEKELELARKRAEKAKRQAEETKRRKIEQQAILETLPATWKRTCMAGIPREITIKSLVKKAEIPEGVVTITLDAFNDCHSLTKVILPSTLKRISSSAFHSCWALKELTIPESVIDIDSYAFSNCRELKTINLPKHLKYLGRCAFQHCDKLKDIEIPDSLDAIPESTFAHCENLETVILPKSIRTLQDFAFWRCDRLTIKYKGTKKDWDKMFIGAGNADLKVIFLEEWPNNR